MLPTGMNPMYNNSPSVRSTDGVSQPSTVAPNRNSSQSLDELKNQIRNGTYTINFNKLATSIIASGQLQANES